MVHLVLWLEWPKIFQMLPSMPVLFTRDSQDAFGNKIQPSTSFFNQNSNDKSSFIIKPSPTTAVQDEPKVTNETKHIKEIPQKQKPEPPKKDYNAFETALIRSYYTKVQSRFSSNISMPKNKFVQFQNTLKTFDPNKETPVDLFRKIEQLFGEEHKDIVEDFLLFLKPGQAAEVGRFMDRFMLVRITAFIESLQNAFARKPTVLRKVIRAITTGLNSGNSEDTKARVLPHLRSHARLTQMFKSLFPDERPSDSLYETGTDCIDESFLTKDTGCDVWEFVEPNDNRQKPDYKKGLDTAYLNGRVFLQHGRLLRSARVTYPYSKEPYRVHARRLAPAQCHLSPPDSDEERSSPKRNAKTPSKIAPKRPKKQLKSPTKNVKDVNDNTKHKDCAILSPKAKKQQNVKPKSKEVVKRKDSKGLICKNEGSRTKQTKIESVASADAKKAEIKSNWTRDEDKTMLQVLKGEAGSEQVFRRIRQLLPHRSPAEIKERFCHVMKLLQQMSVGEVT